MIVLNIFDDSVIKFIAKNNFISLYESCLDIWLKK